MNKTVGIIITIAASIAFSVYPACSRAVYADGGNATFMVILTICVRAMGLVFFCLLARKPLMKTRTDIRLAFTGGFLQAFSVLGIFASFAYLPGPVAIIILYTHTLMLLFYMAWRREIKLNALALITTVAALGGLSLVLDIWHPQQLSWIGIGIVLAAAVATMSRLYVWGNLTKTRDPAIVGAETFVFAAFFVLLLPLVAEVHLPVTSTGYYWALLACIALVLGTFGMFYGISRLGSFEYSLLCKIEPIFTAIFSAVLIHEFLSWHQYVGMLVVLGSLAAYQFGTIRLQRYAVLPVE